MKIVVLGIGGVGGYFGGKLAKTDHHVTFIARGPHMEAIKENGLQVKSIYGDFLAIPEKITDSLTELDPPDLFLMCTKSWQLEEIAQQIKPLLAPETMVLPLQNGADNIDKLRSVIPEKHLIGGLCRIISFIEEPGVIRHAAFHPQVIFGELNNVPSERLQRLKEAFDAAEVDNVLSDQIQVDVWRKFLFITIISGLGALTRAPIGVMRKDPFIRDLMYRSGLEIIEVANAKKIPLTIEDLEKAFIAIDKQDPDSTASTQRDIMEGKPSELEDFNGYIVREGKRFNVNTPVNEFIYRCLLPMELKARG